MSEYTGPVALKKSGKYGLIKIEWDGQWFVTLRDRLGECYRGAASTYRRALAAALSQIPADRP